MYFHGFIRIRTYSNTPNTQIPEVFEYKHTDLFVFVQGADLGACFGGLFTLICHQKAICACICGICLEFGDASEGIRILDSRHFVHLHLYEVILS